MLVKQTTKVAEFGVLGIAKAGEYGRPAAVYASPDDISPDLPALSLVLALVRHNRGDEGQAFINSFAKARAVFRRHKLRRDEVFELISHLIRRGQAKNGPREDERVSEVKTLRYKQANIAAQPGAG